MHSLTADGGLIIEVYIHFPYTKAASKQLKQDLAHFHASRALKMIEALHCPAEQKLELLDKIIENLKSSKDTYNDLDKAPTSSYQGSGC